VAQAQVLQEVCKALNHVKEAIVEFVASQWNRECLTNLPQLFSEIQGGLSVLPAGSGLWERSHRFR
jgi:chemosensory pili system protein ChpA (sensor histidine kinase/response regulator)